MLFAASPFKERENDINVWGLVPAAPESGISRPSQGIHKRTPIGSTYDAFDSERYILTFENRSVREIAANAPYDVIEILTNTQTYGGGGIFNLYSTVAADSAWAPYIFVHEFGHHLAGLADEYYTSQVAYLPSPTRVEPWEAERHRHARSVEVEVEGSRHARHAAADAMGEGRAGGVRRGLSEAASGDPRRQPARGRNGRVVREAMARSTAILAKSPYAKNVGAFEGANYEARGYYRPQVDCIMFSRNVSWFCEVCRRALNNILDLYSA